jgi:hypothetical protein
LIREPGEIRITAHGRHGEEQGFQGDTRLRGQQGLAENLPMPRFHRTPMLRGAQLEPVDDLWVNIRDDEMCHVMLLLRREVLYSRSQWYHSSVGCTRWPKPNKETAGEVIFAGTSPLTKHVFKRLTNVNHAYFRLRQQSS